jgi:glycosyltransferase involved in cell wall biosynthesis
MGNPLFSIIVTAYNREQYIGETLESISAQSFQNFELIVADDCSTDNTYALALSYRTRFRGMRISRNESNLGQFRNRNFAASLAKGEYILYVDSDDTIKADTLQYLADIVKIYEDIGFFIINKLPASERCLTFSPRQAYVQNFYKKSILHVGPGGTLIKRKLFEQMGGFPLCYGVAGDMYYNLLAAAHTDILLLDYDFLNYRRHDGQEINKKNEYLIYGYIYFNDILSRPDVPLTTKEKTALINKSKRRFLINCFHDAFQKKSVISFFHSLDEVNFTYTDFIKALFA